VNLKSHRRQLFLPTQPLVAERPLHPPPRRVLVALREVVFFWEGIKPELFAIIIPKPSTLRQVQVQVGRELFVSTTPYSFVASSWLFPSSLPEKIHSTGGCIIAGGNQSAVNCNGNTQTINGDPGTSAGTLNIQLPVRQLVAVISVMLCIGYVMGDNNAGGCIINGGTQTGVNCSGNSQTIIPSTSPSTASILSNHLLWCVSVVSLFVSNAFRPLFRKTAVYQSLRYGLQLSFSSLPSLKFM
jgi:hypothetical protein